MMDARWTEGPEVELKDMLLAREQRVQRREDGLAHYRMPMITFSVVMPGSVKLCPMSELIAKEADQAVRERLSALGWESHLLWSHNATAGPEALFAVACEADLLKKSDGRAGRKSFAGAPLGFGCSWRGRTSDLPTRHRPCAAPLPHLRSTGPCVRPLAQA